MSATTPSIVVSQSGTTTTTKIVGPSGEEIRCVIFQSVNRALYIEKTMIVCLPASRMSVKILTDKPPMLAVCPLSRPPVYVLRYFLLGVRSRVILCHVQQGTAKRL